MAGKSSERLWFDHALLPSGWASGVAITIERGLIADVSVNVAPPSGAVRGRSVLPGLTNLHSHAFQRAMSGLTEVRENIQDSFWSWRTLLYRFVSRIGPEDVHAIAAMAYAEMLEAGFTRVCEFHYVHNDEAGARYADPAEMAGQVVRAAGDTGLGLTLLPVFYAHSGFGGQPPLDGQRRFLSDLEGFATLMDAAAKHGANQPDFVLGFAPHSLRAVTRAQLKALLAMDKAGPVHIHIAEQAQEVADCLAWSGARPVEWLLHNADVDARWCLVHATHTNDREIHGIAKSGAVAGLCPVTEANLGDGIFDGRGFVSYGGHYGVGTDSNVSIGAADELRMLEYSQRFKTLSRNVLTGEGFASTGRSMFEHALAGGGRAAGISVGLAPGNPADMAAITDAVLPEAAMGDDRLLDAWVFRAKSGAISDVWRRGEHVVQGGHHIHRPAIEARYKACLEALLA
ncbi:formiminoglutamate deiminase [Hyphomonas neptunium ATCC 15444]|uniref:Formiminoglutamate deiminase n=2 Tax=Hyphomonas TaxID=85 RepID=Q0BZK4_HYPNA|nr:MULTISPECIES: formimidoylglutamate deiminase [Hyphomonas]ABI76451.1 formiminoglutamate deiminase [Hyphomonas neptunium ATCC 15444]